ncbi:MULTISPECIES: TolC family protein [unclassified Myroides]|uniref:TolC family protein n=1 Tax=unclassified Myroides TaxID=2642485 RepID=UPI0015FA7FE1|nr:MULTISPECIES: TolC family protein [unclassified Myroides]MBB1149767.1 TolC family protein [Myroides sp. NP-2]MDM1408624.1 TolC family protein [Myroides sp. DF42-4-2]
MKSKWRTIFGGFAGLLLSTTWGYGQQLPKKLTVEETIELALANHQQLKISAQQKNIANQQTQIAQLAQLPTIGVSATAAYLGDALILDRDFSKVTTTDIPHFGNSYAIQASELLYKGGAIKKSIELAKIGEQLAELDWMNDQQSIKFLVISNYLDLYKLINQQQVYQNNKQLGQIRLENVKQFYSQGMLTRNEVIRAELALQNIDQALLVVNNMLSIVNYNLAIALGLDTQTKILPSEGMEEKELLGMYEEYLNVAYAQHPTLKLSDQAVVVADKKIELAKTDQYPALAAVGGYSMSRPMTTSTPVLDMYTNTWQVGVSLNYSLDNLYKAPKKIKLERLQKQKAEETKVWAMQQVEMSVHAAYTKYEESIQQASLLQKSQQLAQENYRIIESKYYNQLAIQAEMTDATNAKLEAELNYANAQIQVLYQYYSLVKATGTL